MWGFFYASSQLLHAVVSLGDNSGGWSKHFNSRLVTLSRESVELPNSVNLMVCDPLVLIRLYRFHFRSGSQTTRQNSVAPWLPPTARKDFKVLSPLALSHTVPSFCLRQFWLWSDSSLIRLIHKLRSFLPDQWVEMAHGGYQCMWTRLAKIRLLILNSGVHIFLNLLSI